MPRLSSVPLLAVVLAWTVACGAPAAYGQRHSLGSAPPTAPPLTLPHPATSANGTPKSTASINTASSAHGAPALASGPIAPISSGLGAIQFISASYNVPAPQTLTRQLQAEDERVRIGALSSIGAPGQYLTHGHAPYPHSVQLDMVQLSNADELDALLTVELDQHIVSAVLVPEEGNWRRVATLSFASAFSDTTSTPSTFVRPLRSWLQPGRYRAVYHATVNGPAGDFTENEADLRVVNGRAVVVLSFVSGARQCDVTGQLRPPHQTCELIQRWLEPDPTDPTHHFVLITGIGHISAHENDDPLSQSRNYRLTRLRSFACQPFIFSEGTMRFEPTANSSPCARENPHEPPHEAPHEPPPHDGQHP